MTVPTGGELRRFGLMVGGIFGAIGLWPTVVRAEQPRLWAVLVAAVLILGGLACPRLLGPIYRAWMAVGDVLGWINTRLVLGVIFFGVITPIGVAMRLFGRDAMQRGFEKGASTYRLVRRARPGDHMSRQF